MKYASGGRVSSKGKTPAIMMIYW